jgi:ABC-2 type transport system permease protein
VSLVRVSFLRVFAEIKRYLLNLISSLLIFVIIFTLIVLGFKVTGQMGSDLFKNTAVGYFVWLASMSPLTDLSWTIMSDMQRGIIEQIFISPYGPVLIYSMYELALNVLILPIIYLMMIIIFSMANISIAVHPSFFYYMIMAMLQMGGIGLALAGLTLRYKRTQAVLNLAQFAIVGFLFLNPQGWVKLFVPLVPHFQAMGTASGRVAPSIELFFYSTSGTVLYIALGIFMFSIFVKSTLRRGDLSMY